MARIDAMIEVLSGSFESQIAVFAHVMDLTEKHAWTLDFDRVEVICKEDPTARLSHYFAPDTVHTITDMLGLDTTVVLVLPGALSTPFGESDLLRARGLHAGTVPVP